MTTATRPAVRIYRDVVDKSNWGNGPWQLEPDKVQWTDPTTGLPCLALRHPEYGNWCGYVGLPPEHPLYGHDWYDTDELHEIEVEREINYSDGCQPGPEAASICHVPEPGQPDQVWWVGFHCGGAWDVQPAMQARLREHGLSGLHDTLFSAIGPFGEQYRTLFYVRDQCKLLAARLAAISV